ncbi:hypothetical protein NDU88_009208, partial [Pleurodeles waltl]
MGDRHTVAGETTQHPLAAADNNANPTMRLYFPRIMAGRQESMQACADQRCSSRNRRTALLRGRNTMHHGLNRRRNEALPHL